MQLLSSASAQPRRAGAVQRSHAESVPSLPEACRGHTSEAGGTRRPERLPRSWTALRVSRALSAQFQCMHLRRMAGRGRCRPFSDAWLRLRMVNSARSGRGWCDDVVRRPLFDGCVCSRSHFHCTSLLRVCYAARNQWREGISLQRRCRPAARNRQKHGEESRPARRFRVVGAAGHQHRRGGTRISVPRQQAKGGSLAPREGERAVASRRRGGDAAAFAHVDAQQHRAAGCRAVVDQQDAGAAERGKPARPVGRLARGCIWPHPERACSKRNE